jgi:hypothetical protein
MLIFDSFRDAGKAEAFAAAVKSECGLDAYVYTREAEAFAADPGPSTLYPPVVHVERFLDEEDGLAVEGRAIALVTDYGGEFVGT